MSNAESIGTTWAAPGQGATVAEIMDALRRDYGDPPLGSGLEAAWSRLVDFGLYHRTNLALTGGTLSAYDLKRIAVCE